MLTKKNRITVTVIILLAFAALITGLFVSQHMHTKKIVIADQFKGTLLQQPREISHFSLVGIDNLPFDNHSLYGQWTMIFFGFTHCGYLCPTSLAELAKMYRLLEKDQVRPLPKVMMISLDPQRDSLPKLANYVKSFDPHFYAARGKSEEVVKMTRELGVVYAKIAVSNDKEADNYDIQHSGAVMLFNPQGELSAFFTSPLHADLLAKDYQLLVS